MNFKKWMQKYYGSDTNGNAEYCQSPMPIEVWNACKKEILKILENEIDNGDCSIATATQKIRYEI